MISPRRLLGFAMLAYVFFSLPYLSRAPLGRDGWRESDVLMVARNFSRSQTPLWQPLVDTLGPRPMVTGMEFPVLNYIGGHLARTGCNVVVATRLVVVACTLLAAASIYGLRGVAQARAQAMSHGAPEEGLNGHHRDSGGFARGARTESSVPHPDAATLSSNHFPRCDSLELRGALAAILFLGSPIVLRYGQSAQPDMPALALALFSLVLLRRACSNAEPLRTATYVIAAAIMALAVAVKLPIIVFGLPAAALMMREVSNWRLWRMPSFYAFHSVAWAPPLLWYRYAKQLQDAQHDYYFNITRSGQEIWHDMVHLRLYTTLLGRLVDVYVCPLVFVMVLIAMYRWRDINAFLIAFLVAIVVYFVLAGDLAAQHIYYGLPAVPVLCYLAAHAASTLLRPRMLMAFGIVAVLWGAMRCRHWLPGRALPPAYETARQSLKELLGPVAVFSHSDPTMLYLLDRRGWVTDHPAAAENAPIRVVDGRRVGAQEREQLAVSWKNDGWEPKELNGVCDVWWRTLPQRSSR